MFQEATKTPRYVKPRLRYVGLVAIVAALSVAVPLGFGASSITPANGKEFLLPNGSLYQLDANGAYHLIPDLPTATEMGVLWSQVKKVSSAGPYGRPLQSVLTLPTTQVRTIPPATMANGMDYVLPGGSLFQLDSQGVYHMIPDILTARAMHVDWSHVKRAQSLKPIGAPLKSVVVSVRRVCAKTSTTAVARANGMEYILPNGNVYQLSGGSYHLIPDIATARRWVSTGPSCIELRP